MFLKTISLILVFIIYNSFTFADDGNNKIKSFSKSKKILSKIHKKNPITFYCHCKYNIKTPNWDSCGFTPRKDKKRASRIEWEHVLPASHFGVKFDTWKNGHADCKNKKGKNFKGRKCTEKIHLKYRKMQADLYNLQPAIGEVNGLRSNYQIDIIKGEAREFGQCDVEIKNKKVEPSDKIRGDVARTYMYMELNYPKFIKFNNSLKKLIIKWDIDDPVDDWECLRAKKIYDVQGNLNKIIEERCNNRSNASNTKSRNSNAVQNKTTNIIKSKNVESITNIRDKNVKSTINVNQKNHKSIIGSYVGAGTKDALK